MKFSRKIELTLYSLFSIITFNKFYICEDCHRVHKRTGHEFTICGGWYEPYVWVSEDCARKTIRKAHKILQDFRNKQNE